MRILKRLTRRVTSITSIRGNMDDSHLTLLMFNLGNVEGVVRSANLVAGLVDELVIIDSSDDRTHGEIRNRLSNLPARVIRALPLGFLEPLRPFGLRCVRGGRVLMLDSDEITSQSLIEGMRDLRGKDAYWLPRVETAYGLVTHHCRLFMVGSVRYRGYIHEGPQVIGATGVAPASMAIIHFASGSQYFVDDQKLANRLRIEAVLRPLYTFNDVLREAAGWGATRALDPSLGDRPVGRLALRLLSRIGAVARVVADGSSPRANWLLANYAVLRRDYLSRLSPPERVRFRALYRAIADAGGPVKFLSLDDPEYVRGLTNTFHWDRSGAEVFMELVEFRFEHGYRKPDLVRLTV